LTIEKIGKKVLLQMKREIAAKRKSIISIAC
jgi:hypothetical protein